MRVLYFHQHFSTPQGAAGTRSYEMARRLVERGHAVTMVCGSYGAGQTGLAGAFSKGSRRGLVDGIDIIEFELPYGNRDGFLRRTSTFLKYAWRSVALSLRHDYELVFATSTPLTAGIPGIVASLLRRKPFVFEVRDLWPELPRAMGVIKNPLILGAMSVLEWASYRTALACIGLAPGIVAGIRRRGVTAHQVHLIPNGCDIDLFGDRASTPWRPEGVGQTDLMAVFAGAHGLANGLGAVLDAAAVLKGRGREEIKLVLIGDGALKSSLVERAKREGLDNCIFHPPVPKVRITGLMRAADAGLMVLADVPAFYYGTSPNKFFDYIAAGIPVLCNYPGWVTALIAQHGCGLSVPPGDASAFASALERMSDRRADLREMGVKGQVLARREFDRRLLADRFVDVLEGAISA